MQSPELPSDEGEESRRRIMEYHQHVMLWETLANKHLGPSPTSEHGLAGRLKHWRELEAYLKEWQEMEDKLPPDPDPPFKKNPHLEAVETFQAEILQAFRDLNMPYLRKLVAAAYALKKGTASKPVDLTGAALLAQQKLRTELRDYPDEYQVRKLVESWYKEGGKRAISDKRWKETLKRIRGLFPKRASLFKIVK